MREGGILRRVCSLGKSDSGGRGAGDLVFFLNFMRVAVCSGVDDVHSVSVCALCSQLCTAGRVLYRKALVPKVVNHLTLSKHSVEEPRVCGLDTE